MKRFFILIFLLITFFGFLFKVNILFANQVDVTFENGDRYIGEVLNNKKHGTGTYIEAGPNGKEYKGEWKNDKQHGKGFLMQNGMEYTGDFFEGKIQGKGVLVDKDAKYEGEFLNGMMHGNGVLKLNDGRIVRGEFKNNKYVGVSRSTNNQLAQEQNNKKVEDEIIKGNPEEMHKQSIKKTEAQQKAVEEREPNSSRANSNKNSTYSDSRLNSSLSEKFANLNPEQQVYCLDKLKRGKIKLDISSNLYYEMENLPLQGLQKKYICNDDGSEGLALFNSFTGAVAGNQNARQNHNPNATPNQPFSLGSPTMKQAIFKLTQAQGYFLEALDEGEHAIAVRQYSMKLNQGTAIGEDDMEKILKKSQEWQTIINKKMKEGFVLDEKAKQTFSQGVPHYASGTALCIAGGFSVASQVSAVTNNSGAAAVIGGIGLAFSAYDSITALNLFFSSTSDIYAFGKENNIENIEEIENAKDSLGT